MLVYLTTQIRQNTHSLNEGQRLAQGQPYEQRVQTIVNNLMALRDSPYVTTKPGPECDSEEGQMRYDLNMRWWVNFCDNLLYQHERGYPDTEYYDCEFRFTVQRFAPTGRALGIGESRPSFSAAVDRVLPEALDPRLSNEPRYHGTDPNRSE